MNSFTGIFQQHFKPPMFPPCIDLSPPPHQILKSPPSCSQHLQESLRSPSFPATPSKSWGAAKPSLFKNFIGGSTLPPPSRNRGGGCTHYVKCTHRFPYSLNWIFRFSELFICHHMNFSSFPSPSYRASIILNPSSALVIVGLLWKIKC